MNWMTAFLWQLQMRKCYRALWLSPPVTLPSSASRNAWLKMDEELIRVMTKAVNELGLEWSPPDEPSRCRLDEWFLPRRHQALRQPSSPFFPEVHNELTKSWHAPFSSRICPSASVALTSVDGTEEKGYEHLPRLDESVAAHLCPPTAIGWKARASHLSKPCRATSALAGCAYSAAGQAASLRYLRSVTDLALRATKATAQAIERSMSSLIVLERHLWLMMTEMKEADLVPFLDALVSSGGLFGPAVEGPRPPDQGPSVKRVGNLQALSINPACLEFRPNDSKVVQKSRLGYVPKVLSTPFRAQVIVLSMLPPSTGSQELSLLCPVRALRVYIEHCASYRKSKQLFIGFGKLAKGDPVTKQGISRWLVDAITQAYSSFSFQCPIGVRAHSTRGIASSWAWSSGVTISEIGGSWLGRAIHICKVLQPGCPCLAGQSPFCLNKLSYGFTWPTLLKPLIHLVYPYYMDARYQLMGPHPGHGWHYGLACAWCILLTPLGLTPTWVLVLSHSTS